MTRASLAPLHNQGAQAYQTVRNAIIECVFAPGAEVSQTLLVERFSLTKASVREALARLSQEGLIRSIPRRGYIVAPVTLRDVEELHVMRMALEPLAARLAAGKIDEARLKKLDAACNVGYRQGQIASEIRFLRANRQFHCTIAEASGNERLARAIAALQDEAMRMLLIGLRLNGDQNLLWQHGHEEIVEAIVTGDGERAEQIQRRQLEYGHRLITAGLMSSAAVVDVNLGQSASLARA